MLFLVLGCLLCTVSGIAGNFCIVIGNFCIVGTFLENLVTYLG